MLIYQGFGDFRRMIVERSSKARRRIDEPSLLEGKRNRKRNRKRKGSCCRVASDCARQRACKTSLDRLQFHLLPQDAAVI